MLKTTTWRQATWHHATAWLRWSVISVRSFLAGGWMQATGSYPHFKLGTGCSYKGIFNLFLGVFFIRRWFHVCSPKQKDNLQRTAAGYLRTLIILRDLLPETETIRWQRMERAVFVFKGQHQISFGVMENKLFLHNAERSPFRVD